MKNNTILIVILTALIFGGGGFLAGGHYLKNQRSGLGQFGRQAGQAGRLGSGGLRPAAGEILSADDKSITVKLQDGSSKIVLLSDKTSINKSSQGSKADLKTGEKVAVFGTENSDGSISAQNVSLNPQLRTFK